MSTLDNILNSANRRDKASLDSLLKQKAKSTMAQGPPGDKATVTKKALEDLKKRAAEAEKLRKDLRAAQRSLTASQQDAEELDKELTNLKKKHKELQEEVKVLKDDYDQLKQEYDLMADDVKNKALAIEVYEKNPGASAPSTKSKVPKKDLNQELVNHVTQTAKTVMFRTWKFIEDELEEQEITREIIPYLPVDIGMEVEEFVANYSNVVYEAIKGARTDVQSSGKKRATELYTKLQDLPTTEQLLEILAMPADELEKPDNAIHKTIQTWYTDRWLPIVIGSEYWDESNRHYKLPTDECTIRKRDGSEETKVLCTIGSEGFGLLIYDNCRDKWRNIMKLKAQNAGAAIPRKGDAAKPYFAKWTLTNEGQKKYGGWKEEGMERFGELQDALEEIRKQDEANGKAKQEYCKMIVRRLHKIPDDATDPADANSAKKRSRAPTPPAIDPSKRKVKRRKE